VDTTVLGCSKEEAAEKPFIASMGIYVFKRTALLEMLENNPSHMDFGGEVIPEAQKAGAVLANDSCNLTCLTQ
jgi:glucose-1-phosphate adenylyltransferase